MRRAGLEFSLNPMPVNEPRPTYGRASLPASRSGSNAKRTPQLAARQGRRELAQRRHPPLSSRGFSRALSLTLVLVCSLGCIDEPAGDDKVSVGVPTGKMGAGLRLRFDESSQIEVGVEMPVRFHVEGRPNAELRVRFLATEGVAVSDYTEETPFQLDDDGKAQLGLSATVPRPTGCYLVARVATGDGRVQEAYCRLGAAEEGEKPGLTTLEDGTKVRIAPSK